MPRRSQHERTETTRAALITSARALFTERGYAGVSAAEIVAASDLTRGAMYHHFADKQDLFRAVFEQLEVEITAEIQAVVDDAPGLLAAIPMGLTQFLAICARPEVIRIGLTDAPAVLGWQQWRQIEAAHALGILIRMLAQANEQGLLAGRGPGTADDADLQTLAQIVLSALIEAALVIAHAPDQAAARNRCEQALLVVLSGVFAQPG